MENIQHPTSNAQHPGLMRLRFHWLFDVGCGAFDVPKTALIFAIQLYRWTVSPVLGFLCGPAGGCRYTPSCSQYAIDAVRSHGVLTGGWLAIKRICRCHPWGGCGHDPAPAKEFRIPPSSLRFDAARVEACQAELRGESGNSDFRI